MAQTVKRLSKMWETWVRSLGLQALRGLPCLGSFSVAQVHQAHRRAPQAGVLLYRGARQALNGAPWVGSYSVVQGSGV